MDEQLIREITAQVVRMLNKDGNFPGEQRTDMGKALVAGPVTLWAEKMCEHFSIYNACEFNPQDDINAYGKVIITRLSLTELSDITSLRETSGVSAAVLQSLLSGIPVIMSEDVLNQYKYKGTGNRRLYEEIGKRIQQLRDYGVCVMSFKESESDNLQSVCDMSSYSKRKLITEQEAKQIADELTGPLHLACGTIVTPLAQDLFRYRNVEIIFEDLKESRKC